MTRHACCCRAGAAGTEQHQRFLVSQRRGPQQLLAMASDLSKQFQVPLIAWGAVAADVTPAQSADGSSSQESSSESAITQVAPGRAFCFLPLPALTSLPVHINGFFELSSNRFGLNADYSCAAVLCIVSLVHVLSSRGVDIGPLLRCSASLQPLQLLCMSCHQEAWTSAESTTPCIPDRCWYRSGEANHAHCLW
jgi:hypothetical protein